MRIKIVRPDRIGIQNNADRVKFHHYILNKFNSKHILWELEIETDKTKNKIETGVR